MDEFITNNWMMQYSLADYKVKQRMAAEMLQKLTVWLQTAGPAALQQEQMIIQRLTSAGVSPNIIAAVRGAFANLRMIMQAAQQASSIPPTTLWRAMIDIFQQIGSWAGGGIQNVGNWVMNGARNVTQSGAGAIAALVSMGRLVVTEAYTAIVAAIEATIGIELFVNAIVVIVIACVLGAIANYFWKKNRKPYEIEDPLLKQASQRSYAMPRPFYGNL